MSDLILVNAHVITMDPTLPKAQLVAIKNGRILHVGRNDSLKDLKDSKTKVINCGGKIVLPGFIDPHFHLYGFAESLVTLNLEPRNNVRSIADIQEKIRQFSYTLLPGIWIRGRGYNEFYLADKRHPNRWDLDAATSDHPIKLTHRSGHAHVLNTLALKHVGISKETADPPEGLIDRNIETGEPTGLLYGMGDYLAKMIPFVDNSQMEHGVRLANTELISFGITSIHDASPRNNFERWKLFRRWKEQGLLKSRINMTLGVEGFNEHRRHLFSAPLNKNQFNIKGVKIIIHETTGRLSPGQEELNEIVMNIHQSGLQVVLHAIEERTIEAGCSAIEFALQRIHRSDHRHRIEHCSVCHTPMAKRLASLGIMVVTQPSFLFYSGERYLRTVPDLDLNHLYPIATLMNNGVRVAGSSDCPIVPPDPLIGIYSAVSRKAESGELVLPVERISPMDALRMYTDGAARTMFEEGVKGSITSGKLADLIILNGDPFTLSTEEIKDIKVEMTIINGEVVWDKIC